ncbi:hypothetical protein GCM10027347_62120 [Larkinella harenae]
MEPEDTKQLWNDFRQGSHAAFSRLYELYASDLYRYGYNLVRNKPLVEDCLHELFLHLYNRKGNLGDTDNIRFYLYCSFRRRLLDTTMKLKKFDSEEYLFDQAEFVIQPYESEWIHEQTLSWQKEMVSAKLNQLPKRQKEMLYLFYQKGLTHQETADIMNITIKSVYNTINVALTTLRKYLKQSVQRENTLWSLIGLLGLFL